MASVYIKIFLIVSLSVSHFVHATTSKEEKKNIAFIAKEILDIKKSINHSNFAEVSQKLHLSSAFDEYEKTFDYLNKNTLEFKSLKYQTLYVLGNLMLDKHKKIKLNCFVAHDTPFDALNMLNKYAKIDKYCITDINYGLNYVIINYSYNGTYFGKYYIHNQLKLFYEPDVKQWFLKYFDITDEKTK